MSKTLKITLISVLALALIYSFAYAKSKHAWLGVLTQTVNNEIADAFDLKTNYGAVVNEVVEDSPAEEAGLQESDVIISINGDQIDDAEDLVDYIYDSDIGDKLTITLMRGDDKLIKEVTLGEKSEKYYKRKIIKRFPRIEIHDDKHEWDKHHDKDFDFDFDWDDHHQRGYIGVLISDLSNQLRDYFGVKEDVGVLIGHVNENTSAEKAGLKAGDVIISVDDKEVKNNIDVMKIIGKKEVGEKVSVKVVRNKEQKTFTVDVEKRDNDHDFSFKYYAPDIDVKIPKIKIGKYANWNKDFHEWCDSDEFKECIKELNLEMMDLKEELKDLEKEQIEEIEKVLEKLSEELKELRENLKN
jgi:serine protease Do